MNILVSNDDGIFAPGLRTLALAMAEIGSVWVIAPENNQSATGHRKTLHRPLRATAVKIFPPDIQAAYAVDGAPSDCAALGLMGLLDEKIDIVVSGVNSGANLGQDMTYSGTVSVAFEAAIFGVPAVAFSLDSRRPDADYSATGIYAKQIVKQVMQHGLPHQTILNVNFPHRPLHEIVGVKVTQQGLRDYRDVLDKRIDPFGKAYYWIGGVEPAGDVEAKGTDIWAVYNGFVSVTPVHLYMTRYEFIATLNTWDWEVGKPEPEASNSRKKAAKAENSDLTGSPA